MYFVFSSTVELRLEEIGAAASKEYSLEKAMDKMKGEWTDLEFSFSQYRDTVRARRSTALVDAPNWPHG